MLVRYSGIMSKETVERVALKYSSTKWSFVLDADAVPSHDALFFENTIKRTERDLPYQDPIAFVVPVIGETVPWQRDPSTQPEVVELFKAGLAKPMHSQFRPAYLPTNYERWLRTSVPFSIPYQLQFEPV